MVWNLLFYIFDLNLFLEIAKSLPNKEGKANDSAMEFEEPKTN